jgi:hypothetical protein
MLMMMMMMIMMVVMMMIMMMKMEEINSNNLPVRRGFTHRNIHTHIGTNT